MPLSLTESQAVNEIAQFLYDFLPGTPHPFADQSISFAGVAHNLGLSGFWTGGSKFPAIATLLEKTLEIRRELFCNLILDIVRKGLVYRNNKGNPITRDDIRRLNELVTGVSFKIPDLWDPAFLDSLPHGQKPEQTQECPPSQVAIGRLKQDLVKLTGLYPQARGYAFERFLNELFTFYKLNPRSSFRIVGEQIDGSFQLGSDTYLVEAKWRDKQIGQNELLIFQGKVGGKSTWSRGLFVSYSGFTSDGLQAFSRGRPTSIIGMNCQDIFFILEGELTLIEAINRKARRAAETGEFFISVYGLSKGR